MPVLYVEDAARAVAWYGRLGFVKEWEHQFEPGFPWFVSVARGNVRLYLSEHKGDARPDTLIHLYVKDIDAVSEEFGIPVDEEGLAGRECALETRTATGCASRPGAPDHERWLARALALRHREQPGLHWQAGPLGRTQQHARGFLLPSLAERRDPRRLHWRSSFWRPWR